MGKTMTATMQGAVVIHYDDAGKASYYVFGDERVRLFFVDERAPGDRVYEWLNRAPPELLRTLLGDSPIGSNQDSRHEAIKARVLGNKPKVVT